MSQCPAYPQAYAIFSGDWLNHSRAFESNGSDYEQYLCRYSGYYDRRIRADTLEGHLVLLFSGFGFFGGLLTVLTLTQSTFRILNFRLFLLIGYLEMLQMAVLALMDGLAYVRCDASYTCTFLWAHVGITIMNVCADATDLLVLFLCSERTVACLLPHHFQRIHNQRVYKMAVCGSLLLPAAFSVFQAFELSVYEEPPNRYTDRPSEFSKTLIYAYIKGINTIRFYVTAVLVASMTGLSIWGFCAVANRRRKLTKLRKHAYDPEEMGSMISAAESDRRDGRSPSIGGRSLRINNNRMRWMSSKKASNVSSVNNSSTTTRSGMGNSKTRTNRQTELCCLQLCLAIPVVVNHILYATGLNSDSNQFVLGEDAVKLVSSMELDWYEANEQLDAAESFQYLRAATNVSNVLAHALHFYLYLMFSVKVRHGFIDLLRACIMRRRNGGGGQIGSDSHRRRSPSGGHLETTHIIQTSSVGAAC